MSAVGPPDPFDQRAVPSGDSASVRAEHAQNRVKDLAENLPRLLPCPFSGRVAFEVGDGPIVQASHFPQQVTCSEECPSNVLSVGKLFTSVAVMQLQEEGRLSLDTPLSDLLTPEEMDLELRDPYLQDKPSPADLARLRANAHRITVRDLLTHRSGLTLTPESPPERFFEVLPENISHPYSNYGFQLLARIIGKHSPDGNAADHEAGFRNHILERIFKPADMKGAIKEIRYP